MAATAQAEKAKTLSAPEVAKEWGVEAKQLRRYLRAAGKGVSQGNRYEFQRSELRSLKSGFEKWAKEVEAKRAAREAEKAKTEAAGDEAKS